MADDKLLKVAEAADWLGIGVSTLEKLVAARKVPHTRLGGRGGAVRFSREHLDAIVAAGEQAVVRAPTRTTVTALRTVPQPPPQPPTPPPPPSKPPAGPSSPPPPAGPPRRAKNEVAA